jgi:hypothetical protein
MSQFRIILRTAVLTVGLFFGALECFGVIITPDRLPANGTWQGIAGVPGGIPNRTNIFVNLLTTTNLNYRCVPDGETDNLLPISNALNDCPYDEVVYLPAGEYFVSADITTYNSYWTLRGDGIGKTVIVGVGNGVFNIGNAPSGAGTNSYNWATPIPIISGGTKGSTSITLGSTSNLYSGELLWLEQADDGINVFGYGVADGTPASNGDDRLNDGTHDLNMRVLVTNIVGNVVSFTPALLFDFDTNLSPQAVGFGGIQGPMFSGLEELTVEGSAGAIGVGLTGTYAFWLKDVELTGWATFGFEIGYGCVCTEVRECYVHEPASYDRNYGYAMQLDSANNTLVEDNIFWHNEAGIIVQGSCGNVFGYNFLFQGYNNYGGVNIMSKSLYGNHTPYPNMNLFEGNYSSGYQQDFFYGPGRDNTLFGNYLTGTDPDVTQSRVCVSLDSHQWSNNVVGNILGSVGTNAPLYSALVGTNIVWANTTPLTWLYDPGTEQFPYDVSNVIFRLGYPGSGNNGYDNIYFDGGTNDLGGLDATVRSNTIIHGNWDYATQTINWSPTIADTNLPNSYYLSGKPSWWGSAAWPPFNPNNAAAANITNLPAGFRFVNQAYPVAIGSILPTPLNSPPLFISLATNTPRVTWPGYILQQNSDLTSTNWITATNAITVIGNQYQTTATFGTRQEYYRLQSTIAVPTLQEYLTASNTLILTWSGYLLQQNSNLATTNWLNVTNPITVAGNQYQIMSSPMTSQQYYRLIQY